MIKESNIEQALIDSCTNLKPEGFIPFLLESRVKTVFPNKVRFYQYFKSLIKCAKKHAVGSIRAKRVKPYEINFKGGYNLSFYDDLGRELITLEFFEDQNRAYLDAHPF